jgi:hypothetical protein
VDDQQEDETDILSLCCSSQTVSAQFGSNSANPLRLTREQMCEKRKYLTISRKKIELEVKAATDGDK